MMEDMIRDVSVEIFGTKDFESMLKILNPHDGMVKEFKRRVTKLKQRYIIK